MSNWGRRKGALLAALLLLCVWSGAVGAATAVDHSERSAWLLQREGLQDLAATGHRFEQGEIGGGGGVPELEVSDPVGGRRSGALPVLASLVLPGAGEAMLGHKRGYLLMAADLFAWSQVIKNHNDGSDLRDQYYAYADAHYTDERLVLAYTNNQPEGGDELGWWYDRQGPVGSDEQIGTWYFNPDGTIDTVADLDVLPLYVTAEADFREYYENLGKWNQFVFGWDDFVNPYDRAGYTPTGNQLIDLNQPWVSEHREVYRLMRDEANTKFKNRDRWLYANIGLRIFSVLETAYLQGMLGGGPAKRLEVSGHEIRFHAQPMGLYRGAMAASVTF